MARIRCSLSPLVLIFSLALALPGRAADADICPDTRIKVHAARTEDAARTCRAAEVALTTMAQCNMPLARPITITLHEALPQKCLGLYHCGEDRIDILSPAALSGARSTNGPFAHLPTLRLFDSLVAHELAHAVFDAQPCPVETCITAAEYLAYTAQIRVLTEAERAPFTAAVTGLAVSRDEINAMLLFMAPQIFAKKAWAHLHQRMDPCAFVGQVMSGHILLDRFHP